MTHDFEHHLASSLPKSLRALLITIGETAASCDMKAYLVGGTVRDSILGIESRETAPDVVIVGDLESFALACIERSDTSRLVSVSQHHTARIEIRNQQVELAAAREDTYQPFGSLPKTYPVSSIEDDLRRRDFSVNAMAVRLLPEGFGEFHDPLGGQQDCSNNILRAIRRYAFLEDPTRMLRGVRIAARCGLEIEHGTWELISQAQTALCRFVMESPNRLFNEFAKWFQPHENLKGTLGHAHRFGVLEAVGLANPDLHVMTLLESDGEFGDSTERFAIALQCFGSPELQHFNSLLPLPKAWRELLTQTVEFRLTVDSTDWFRMPISTAVRIIRRYDALVVSAVAAALCEAELGGFLRELNRRAGSVKTSLSGKDIERLGVPHGPMVGELLDRIVDMRLDGHVTSVAEEVDYVKSHVRLVC